MTYIPDRTAGNRKIVNYLHALFLRKLGVETVIYNPKSFRDWIQKIATWDYDMTINDLFNWGDPVIGVHRSYLSSNIRKGVIFSNTQGYRNQQVDALLEQAGTELVFEKRYALYKQFQEIITDELPVYPIFRPLFATAYHKNLG